MRNQKLHIPFLFFLLSLFVQAAQAQLVRYVTTTGTYAGDGLSWATAKNNLQDAINDLHNYMQQKGISEGGRIYVAQGKYVPTESTEQSGGGVLFTSFKMYAGISVYGGYKGDESGDALEPDNRPLKGGATKPWEMKYQTILSGNHSSTQTVFQWDPTNKKEVYTTSFPGNSYHVVWFATNGLDDKNRAKPLGGTALLDGCIIEEGNASNRSVETVREHTAFGAGIYMTAGAKVDRCIVRHNESTRRGGGIYLDNGGEVDRCYIYANQCLGIGIVAGYGGGVCVDDEGKVLRSLIHNNVARIGGGACLSAETVHQKAEENAIGVNTSDCFNPALAGSVVSNNTSTTEAGGVFMYKGGQMNHNTIVRNKCTGPNVIISGRRYGRSAGVYVDKAAMISNSVLWGGQVDANSDVQYASYTVESTELLYPYISYTAISNHDLADWTSTSKLEVLALGTKNTATSSTDNQYYPRFLAATSGIDPDNIKPGVEADNATATPETRWMPAGFSPLREHGVQIVDIATYDRALISHLTTDMNGNTYAARTTIGAYVPTKNTYTPRLLPSVEPGESGDVLTLFVDPNRNLTTLSGEENVGHSWDKPLGNINDALNWFLDNRNQSVEYYADAATNTLTTTTIGSDTKLQVLVKAGTCTTAGSYFSSRMRSSYIRMYDNTRVYGGYPADATGTSRDGRNPSENLTTISANIISNGYAFNTCHIVGFAEASNAVLDGFRLSYANSLPNDELNNSVGTGSTIYFNPALKDGGAIVIQNEVGNFTKPMTGNKVRNCILSNCTSNQGAAIFVQSTSTAVNISLDVENVIVHNNTSTTTTTPAAVWVESESGKGGNVTVNFNHCDFLKNVGYGLYVKGGNATVKLDNSVVWANASIAMDRSENLAEAANAGKVRTWMTENGGNLSGSYNFFDTGTSITGFTNSQSTLTYLEDAIDYTYPIFVNPTKNIGATHEGDLTKYGGHVKFMPRNMNPIVNAAVTSDMAATDITSVVTRSYGGAADVGAVENTFLPENGNVFYVTPTGAGRKDGTSWSNAIAGNEVYDLITKKSLGIQTTADAYLTGTYKETSVSTSGFWDSGSGNTINTDKKGNLTGVTITNNRYERYISGLQFAVETASSASSSADKKEVWIAGGTYTDYKGYVIRDKIIVYGGFPDFGTPGMDERHPLLSTSIPVSKTNQNLESQIAHYETILQISSTESVKNNGNFVSPANWLRNESSVIRRPVLRQPDVCLPTYGPAASGKLPESNNGRYASNTYRFPGAENGKTDANYVEYEGAVWDGFTIQNGYIVNYYANRDGGAGVRMFRGVTLRNSVVKRNMNYSTRNRGGGVYCDGSNSVVENCFIFNNNAEGSGSDFYGGGMYMIVGTGFNLLVTRNYATSNGGGLFIENATFYNNTVAYNNSEGCGGIYQWSGDYLTPSLDIFNCLLYGNNHKAIDSSLSGTKFNTNFKAVMNCYIQTAENLDSKFSTYNKIGNSNYLGTGTALENPFDKGGNAVTALDFSLSSASKCINSGLNDPNNVTLPETDVDFTARIQDCTVDIGAYEYNGAYDIAPTSGTAADGTTPTATYYVTGPGMGTASAQNPANAACMQKLQKVLDAAGRYKFTNPGTQVIVKLARVAGGGYAPSRSYVTEKNNAEADNPRTYSLMVPRGVEVWGGYLEEFEEDQRDVIANSTLLTGAYTSDGQNVNCYHVVTFTDNLFDENGELIGTGHTTTSYNSITDPTLNPALSSAATKLDAKKDRAILDGLYIEDGDAEGEITTSSEADINRYGGAAIVPDYAHVRNCILRNNTAANGGGALFLQEGALVSGCIMTDNSADKGGAIYVQQSTKANFDPTKWDYIRNFAHIISCTISDNEATSSGGGLWFNNNVRVNSSVLWNNKSNNAANVNGQTDPFSTQAESNTSVFYPFSYSAVENIRMAGMNNISVSTTNEKGVRFVSRANTDGNDYYYLQHYSVLARAGMSQQDYTNIRVSQPAETDMRFYFPTLEAEDMAGNSRTTYNMNGSTLVDPPGEKDFVEIGARAYNGPLIVTPTADNLITRLFVVKPEDIDEDIFEAMSTSSYTNGKPFVEGCSFAFPMQKLDDALLYVQTARKTLGETDVNGTKVKDTKFEIFVSRGTYYPYRTVTGQYSYSRGNTFLVPEGVSIFGGLRDDLADGTNTDTYFYTSTDTDQELTATITVDGSTTTRSFTLKGQTTENILRARELEDLNHNSLMEPWEMKYQTILSGKSVNSETADNVYHVITCIADEEYVGTLPTPTNTTETLNIDNYTREHTGVPILLDGLQIMDGKALGYDAASVANAYSYYKGGGVLVDGNWQKPTSGSWNANGTVDTSDEIHSRSTDPAAVGKRCIPLVVRNCEFTNNRAGAGGAIYSNGVVEIFSSNFAQNASKQRDEVSVTPLADLPETSTKYNGNGGAIYSTYVLSAINTIFANNEAGLVEETADLNNLTDKGSRGGAVFHGATTGYGSLQMVNCNFVRNQALSYPAIYLCYPNRGDVNMSDNPHKVVNSIFWGNEITPDCTISGSEKQVNFVCSYWNRVPTNGAMADDPSVFTDARLSADGLTPGIGENLWFCAYEEGRGCEPRMDDRGTIDYRTISYTLNEYIPNLFKTGTYWENGDNGTPVKQTFDNNGTKYIWVTNNIYLSDENNALNGPNFVNPSLGPGVNNYLPSADWMMSRQNNLTDNGWSRIQQQIKLNDVTQNYDCSFVTDAGDYIAQGIYADTRNNRKDNNYIKMPIGNEMYMEFTDGSPMFRISKDPNPSQNQTYIDLGVYEYQHIQLNPKGDETDVLWVSTQEKPENGVADGSSWRQPTSDMQRAIETLLASRNNHHKQINVIEGNYSPIYTIDGYMAFTINSGSLNAAATLPLAKDRPGGEVDGNLGVKSLTILGGWSKDVENLYNAETYPTTWEMAGRSGVAMDKMSTLLRIVDAHNWYNVGSNASRISATQENAADNTQRVIPITIDGITFQNVYGNKTNEGAAIYYSDQYQFSDPTERDETLHSGVLAAASADGAPKLKLGRSIFRLNGNAATVPAVTIGQGGGSSLVYNTLFHSNMGQSLRAFNTHVVNCTFALNGDNVGLQNDAAVSTTPSWHSSILNSLLWRNGAEDAKEYDLPSETTDYLSGNAIFGEKSVYTAGTVVNHDTGVLSIALSGGGTNDANQPLVADNADVLCGPNFMLPLTEAVAESDKELRDFHLRPSARTINKGDNILYLNTVGVAADTLSREKDLAFMPRFAGSTTAPVIDRGAYEYQGDLQRVIYVDPTRMVTGDGTSWGNPYGHGELQSAIDLAAVFSSINTGRRAYVFCKGGQLTGERLTPRAGVSVFAGIEPNYTQEAIAMNQVAEDTDPYAGGYYDKDLTDYVTRVLGDRPGIVSPSAQRTGITGVQTAGNYAAMSLLDGFDIAPQPADVTTPVVDLGDDTTPLPVVLRNAVIHDVHNTAVETASGAAAAVRARGGLLYNVLVRDCSAQADGVAATFLGNKGRAVNCTFLGTGATGYALETSNDDNETYQVNHCITWNEQLPQNERLGRKGSSAGYQNCNTLNEGYPFARYLQSAAENHPAKPAAFTDKQDLWYQLEEKSKHLDFAGTDFTDALYNSLQSALGLSADERAMAIQYATDRDLLGNPRLPQYNALIDRGCYETWNVPEGKAAKATYAYTGESSRGHLAGGRRHPQEGSVVYVQKNASLVMSSDDFNPASTTAAGRNEVLRPGYLLLCEGASLFSEGTAVSLGHVGVERTVNADAGALVALPYAFDFSQARYITYDASGQVQETVPEAATEVLYYDGEARATYNYIAQTEPNSPCWKPCAAGERAACMGVWYHPTASGTYRFTAADVSTTDGSQPVYREGYFDGASEAAKMVTLTQYDNRDVVGEKPYYTVEENMGWNLVGSPYLVSDYPCWLPQGTSVSFAPDDYPMSLPRFFYTADALGNFSAHPSWNATEGKGLSPATAFFTQTATLQSAETLRFLLPHYAGETPVAAAPGKVLSLTDGLGRKDEVTLQPDVDNEGSVAFHLGTDGLHWSPLQPGLPQLYAATAQGTPLAWAASVPVCTAIPLGLNSGAGGLCKLGLPEPEAFADFTHVWLTDKVTGLVTDLKHDVYTVPLEAGEATDIRFTLQFGGVAPNPGASGEQALYQITARQGYIHIEGLLGGENIAVYDASGRLLLSEHARTNHYAAPFLPGNYVVKVEGYSRKVQVAP